MKLKSINKLLASATVLAIALAFTSCLSIPDPKTPESSLIYGEVLYRGVRGDNVTEKKGGIKFTVTNIKTRKSTVLTSTANGTISKMDLPAGTYWLSRIDAKFNYEDREWWFWQEFRVTDESQRFEVRPGVTNLGLTKLNVNYGTNKIDISSNLDFDGVQMRFMEKYPDSKWIFTHWNTKGL